MTQLRWMVLGLVVTAAGLLVGYLTWPSPGGNQPSIPVARLDEGGTPYVAYRSGRDDWDLLPLVEAHGRAQRKLGFTFRLPDLPQELLFPARIQVLTAQADEPLQQGDYRAAEVTYVLHPIIDGDGRVRLPSGIALPARDNQNVPMWLTIEYPAAELVIPRGADEIATKATPRVLVESAFISSQTSQVDTTYTWVVVDVLYRLMYTPDVRWYPRDEMLAIVDATALR